MIRHALCAHVGQEAAAAFAPEDELLVLLFEDDDELSPEEVEEAEELEEVEEAAGVLSAFFAGASPVPPAAADFSALTLPDRESLR